MKAWSEADLVRRLCGALGVAERAVGLMAAEGYTDPDDPARSVRGEKVVGETGLLLLAAAPVASRPEVRERLERVAGLLLGHARGARVRARVCLEPSLALEHALAHLCLAAIGYPDRDLDVLLSESLQAESAGGRERPPHRELEQDWMLRLSPGLENRRVDRRLPARSALGRPIDLLSLHKDDGYAFTHSLMYVTDLGARRVRLPRSPARVAAEAEAACAASLDEPDYDLCGELLLTWPYLRRRWSSSAALSFAVLASVEDRLGFLPAPGVALERLATLRGAERSRYIVTNSYHSTFVMGLLCAGSLRAGCAPPVALPGRGRYVGAAAELLPLIGSSDAEPAWRDHFEELPSREQDAAAPFLFNVCLRRATLRRDLAAVRSALLVAEKHELLGSPAAGQAAELLRRSATFGNLTPRTK